MEANKVFHKLTALYNRITLLADLFSTTTFGHGRSGSIGSLVLPSFTGTDGPKILPELGALHRACIWENIVLKGSLATGSYPDSGTNLPTRPDLTPSTAQANAVLNEPDALSALPGLTPVQEDQKPKESSKKDSPQEQNAKALKYVATQIPTSLTPFFQGEFHPCLACFPLKVFSAVVRLPTVYSRRNPDTVQRNQAMSITGYIADVALRHLQVQHSGMATIY